MTTSTPGGPPSASRWPAGVNRQLSVESPLVGGPRFAAGDIGGKVRIFVQDTRWFHPEQHPHYHQASRPKPAVEPVGTAEASGKLLQPLVDAILDQRQALLGPGPVTLENPGGYEFKDRRLHRVDRRKHPGDRARPRTGIIRQQSRVALSKMKHDRPCLEQGEIAFLVGRIWPKGCSARCAGS